MKKTVTCILAAAMITAAFAGCGTKNTANKDGEFTLTIGGWPTQDYPDSAKRYDDWKKEIESKTPGLTVIPYTSEITLENYLAEAASGQLPDLYSQPFTEPKKVIDAGYVADVTDEMKKRGYDTAIKKNVLDIVTKDGRYYGIPYKGYMMSLYCNKKLFEQAGLTDADGLPQYPDTWEEVAKTGQIIKEKTGKAGFAFQTMDKLGGWMFMNIAWAFGTEFETQEDGKWVTHVNEPEGVAALQYIKDLKWKYNILPDNILLDNSEIDKMYAQDDVAMLIGCYDENTVPAPVIQYNMDKNNMAATVLPAGPAQRSSQLGGTTYLMKNGVTEQQISAAFDWIEMEGSGMKATDDVIERKKQTIEDKISENGPKAFIIKPSFSVWASGEMKNKLDEIYKEKSTVDVKNFTGMYDEDNKVTLRPEEPYYCQQLYGLLSTAIQNVLLDKNADPQSEMDEVAKTFQNQFLNQLN